MKLLSINLIVPYVDAIFLFKVHLNSLNYNIKERKKIHINIARFKSRDFFFLRNFFLQLLMN